MAERGQRVFDFLDESTLMTVAVFGLVLALWCLGGFVWILRRQSQARRMAVRMGLYNPDPAETSTRVLRLWREGHEATTLVPYTSWFSKFRARLRQIPHDAGWDVPVSALLVILIGTMGFVFAMSWVYTNNIMAAAAVCLLVAGALWLLVQQRIHARQTKFEKQFEDALHLVARSLRAGQPLLGAFQLVSDEMEDPVSTIFNDICQQQALGVSLDESIRRVAAASNSDDLKLFATAVVIQLKTGGNLADMMGRLAQIIRERMRLARRVRVLTAQTQYSKRVLLVLPFFVFIMLNVLNPRYMEPMITTVAGRFLTGAAVFSMIVGAWMMNRMAKLRY
jgi:tight adherence protein B